MNKNDIWLMIIILMISSISIVSFSILKKEENKVAKIYYDKNLIKTVDLNIDQTFTVNGYNGEIYIEVKNEKIRVNEEQSPLHLCSKQGYISSSLETIVCLPNKIVIQIESNDSLDTIAR